MGDNDSSGGLELRGADILSDECMEQIVRYLPALTDNTKETTLPEIIGEWHGPPSTLSHFQRRVMEMAEDVLSRIKEGKEINNARVKRAGLQQLTRKKTSFGTGNQGEGT